MRIVCSVRFIASTSTALEDYTLKSVCLTVALSLVNQCRYVSSQKDGNNILGNLLFWPFCHTGASVQKLQMVNCCLNLLIPKNDSFICL